MFSWGKTSKHRSNVDANSYLSKIPTNPSHAIYKHHVHVHHTVEPRRNKQKLPEFSFRLWVRSYGGHPHVLVLMWVNHKPLSICHQIVNGEVETWEPWTEPCVWYYCFNNLKEQCFIIMKHGSLLRSPKKKDVNIDRNKNLKTLSPL